MVLLLAVSKAVVGFLGLRGDLRAWSLPVDLPSVVAGLDEISIEGPIDRLDWLPPGPRVVEVTGCLVREPRLPPGVELANLRNCDLQTLDGLPEGLLELNVFGNSALAVVEPPPGLRSLVVGGRGFTGFGHLPESLESLEVLGTREKEEIDLSSLPRGLRRLKLVQVGNRALLGLPPDLEVLELEDTSVETVEPWPRALRVLRLAGNPRFGRQELPPLLTELTSWSDRPILACEDLPRSITVLRGEEPCEGELPEGLLLRVVEDAVSLPSLRQSPAPLHRVGLRQDLDSFGFPEPLDEATLERLNVQSPESMRLVGFVKPTVADLPGEPSHLELKRCRLRELGNLPPTLRHLELEVNQIGDPSFADNQLEALVYPSAPWKETPAALSGLRSLDVSNAPCLDGISPELRNLVELRIAGTPVRSLPEDLQDIRVLDVAWTPIREAADLPKGLRSLTIHRGQLDSLARFADLRTLHLRSPRNDLEGVPLQTVCDEVAP